MDALGIFVKRPVPGIVKTRLAASVGNKRAAEIYGGFLKSIITKCETLAEKRTLGYVSEQQGEDDPAREYFSKFESTGYELWPQPNGNLGHRMTEFFRTQLEQGASRVVLIGSDSPTLPVDFIQQAFQMLETKQIVIGPSTDGGYYLVGMNRFTPKIFTGIEWSSEAVLEQTVQRLKSANASLGLLPVWYDIDTIEDYRMMQAHQSAIEFASKHST